MEKLRSVFNSSLEIQIIPTTTTRKVILLKDIIDLLDGRALPVVNVIVHEQSNNRQLKQQLLHLPQQLLHLPQQLLQIVTLSQLPQLMNLPQ